MVIFIDESGIHKQIGHSTASVVYVEVTNLEKFEKKLKKIEADLKISYFHWAEERQKKLLIVFTLMVKNQNGMNINLRRYCGTKEYRLRS